MKKRHKTASDRHFPLLLWQRYRLILCFPVVALLAFTFGVHIPRVNAKAGDDTPGLVWSAINNRPFPFRGEVEQWASVPWSGSNLPFEEARAKVDAAIKNGESADALRRKYRATAINPILKANNSYVPLKALDCFRWGYATWLTIQSSPVDVRWQRAAGADWLKASDVYNAYLLTPSPHNYEYDRIRFLISAYLMPDGYLQNVGKRLVSHNPQDLDVKYEFIRVLNPQKDHQQALGLVKELVKKRPSDPSSYARLAEVYYEGWIFLDRNQDAPLALAAYHKYLSLAAPNDPRGRHAEETITSLTNFIHRHQ